MRTFTPDEVEDILKIINEMHLMFLADSIGVDFLTTNDRRILKEAGVDVHTLGDNPDIEHAYKFGLFAVALENAGKYKELKDMSFFEFKEYIKSSGGLPLTPKEIKALSVVKTQASNDITGLGNKITSHVKQIMLDADMWAVTEIEADLKQRTTQDEIITESAYKGVLQQQTAQKVASNIGHSTHDWARDFNRIADYVMQKGYQHGRAEEYRKLYEGNSQVRYYKQVFAGACKHCIRLYLTRGIGSQPRLFTLDELQSNGTNIKVKTSDWKPVIGPTHPYCRCELSVVDLSLYEWSEETKSFVKKTVKTLSKEEGEKEGIKITIGDEVIYV